MRSLKFRAWDVESECYIDEKDWAGITPEGRNIWIVEEEEVSVLPILGEFIVEQSTGLKDKNGKEIYENDIVKEYDEGLTSIGKVEWDDYNAGFCVVWSGSECVDTLEDGYLTVIGNIHKDMELLI